MKIKISNIGIDIDKKNLSVMSGRKYRIKLINGNLYVYRIANSSTGKKTILLAQDILGILCKVKFVDGNTLNHLAENLKPINISEEFFY